MIKVIPSAERYHADMGWLSAYWHFSFAEYHDPANLHWGPLRVFNDDRVAPAQGFPPHPHRDMEIVTCVLEGALEHKDNLGNTGVVRPGEVQVMSAGTGIVHSEFNHSKQETLHLLQLWLLPRTRGRAPRWEQRVFTRADRGGKLLPVVSSGSIPGTMTIDQDAAIYRSALDPGQQVTHQSAPGRKAYLFVAEGEIALNENGTRLAAGDQARVADEPRLMLRATAPTELILLDLPG